MLFVLKEKDHEDSCGSFVLVLPNVYFSIFTFNLLVVLGDFRDWFQTQNRQNSSQPKLRNMSVHLDFLKIGGKFKTRIVFG